MAIVKELCSKFDGDVYLTSRDESRGIAAVQELKTLGLEPKYHQLDIDDEASVLKLRDFLKANYGGLDVLVNNAGIATLEKDEISLKVAKATIRTNFFGNLKACKTLFPILHPHARVVNMSSSVGNLSLIRGTRKAAMELKEKFSSPNLTEEELCHLVRDFVEYKHHNSRALQFLNDFCLSAR